MLSGSRSSREWTGRTVTDQKLDEVWGVRSPRQEEDSPRLSPRYHEPFLSPRLQGETLFQLPEVAGRSPCGSTGSRSSSRSRSPAAGDWSPGGASRSPGGASRSPGGASRSPGARPEETWLSSPRRAGRQQRLEVHAPAENEIGGEAGGGRKEGEAGNSRVATQVCQLVSF